MSTSSATDSRHAAATRHMQSGAYRAAIQLYEALLEKTPDDADVLNDVALAHYQLGRPDEAIAHLERALNVDPSHEAAFFNLLDATLDHEGRLQANERFDRFGSGIPVSAEKNIWHVKTIIRADVLEHGGNLNPQILQTLQQLWGNQTWAASLEYVQQMVSHASATKLPILECGSGLTTIVLGLVTRGTGPDVWSLEHHSEWHQRVSDALRQLAINHVNLCLSPLIGREGFAWYDIPSSKMPNNFGLVVCDGPPGSTPGGRYGLMPVMRDHLAPEAVILMDDIDRQGEWNAVHRWKSTEPLSIDVQGTTRKFAVVRRNPDQPKTNGSPSSVSATEAIADSQSSSIQTTSTSTPSRPPIFIGGAARSGTTLLRAILNAHSHIAIGAELKATPMIAQFWRQLSQYRAHLRQHFLIEQDDIDAAVGELVRSILGKYHAQADVPRIGEKTPNNVFVFSHLHEIFPQSPLLHIIRDGRDVVRSLLQQNWVSGTSGETMAITQDPEAAATYWVNAVTTGRRAAQQSESLHERYLEIRYEDLVSHSEPTARSLFEHIDEDWEPAVLNFHENDASVYEHVHRPISNASVGKWKTALTPDEKSIVKRVAGDLLIDLGYAEDLNW